MAKPLVPSSIIVKGPIEDLIMLIGECWVGRDTLTRIIPNIQGLSDTCSREKSCNIHLFVCLERWSKRRISKSTRSWVALSESNRTMMLRGNILRHKL